MLNTSERGKSACAPRLPSHSGPVAAARRVTVTDDVIIAPINVGKETAVDDINNGVIENVADNRNVDLSRYFACYGKLHAIQVTSRDDEADRPHVRVCRAMMEKAKIRPGVVVDVVCNDTGARLTVPILPSDEAFEVSVCGLPLKNGRQDVDIGHTIIIIAYCLKAPGKDIRPYVVIQPNGPRTPVEYQIGRAHV